MRVFTQETYSCQIGRSIFGNQARHLDLSSFQKCRLDLHVITPLGTQFLVNFETKLRSVVTFMTYFRPVPGRCLIYVRQDKKIRSY
jgi:hypothetical protein